jgi:hypothetical protein
VPSEQRFWDPLPWKAILDPLLVFQTSSPPAGSRTFFDAPPRPLQPLRSDEGKGVGAESCSLRHLRILSPSSDLAGLTTHGACLPNTWFLGPRFNLCTS